MDRIRTYSVSITRKDLLRMLEETFAIGPGEGEEIEVSPHCGGHNQMPDQVVVRVTFSRRPPPLATET
jgi:hypothetical protein